MTAPDELVVDLFAGGGGASEGIRWGLGRDPDVAVDHDETAISMHEANHPGTRHLHGNVWHYDPASVTGGAAVGLLWASPTCTFFSKAKGGPLDRKTAGKVRALATVVTRWARAVRPRVIMVENVEAFASWGPLTVHGKPCELRRGKSFRSWVSKLEKAGYVVAWRELRACDYGAPTSRKRLFVIARCDGEPIVWPMPTHGRGLIPYRTAADCIDWSIPCPSIFDRARPLSDATMARVARGMRKFVFESAKPFLVHQSNGERPGQAPRIYDIEQPLGTAFVAKHFGGHGTPGQQLTIPLSTITCKDHHAIVAATTRGDHREEVRAFVSQYNGESVGQPLQLPLNTITTRDRFAVVTVHGQEYEIADIGMRMLTPRELFRCQGFPESYVIDRWTKTAQVRLVGNSVPPHLSAALVSANMKSEVRRAA